MKQPNIHIYDKHNTDFGTHRVHAIRWDSSGNLFGVEVHFGGGLLSLTKDWTSKDMLEPSNDCIVFTNPTGNLFGKIDIKNIFTNIF